MKKSGEVQKQLAKAQKAIAKVQKAMSEPEVITVSLNEGELKRSVSKSKKTLEEL